MNGVFSLDDNNRSIVLKSIIILITSSIIGVGTSISPVIMLSLVFLAFSILFAFRNPQILFMASIIFVVIEGVLSSTLVNIVQGEIIGAIPEILLMILFGALVLKSKFKLPKPTIVDYSLILIMIWALAISYVQHGDLFLTAFGLRLFFRFILIYWVIRLLKFNTKKIFYNLVRLLTWLIFIQVLISIFQVLGRAISPASWNTFGNNLSMINNTFGVQGTFGRYDALGMFLGFSSIVIAGYYLYYDRNKIYIYTYILAMSGILMSTSRQALIVAFLGLLVLLLAPAKKKFNLKIMVGGLYLGVLTGLILFMFAPDISSSSSGGRNPLDLVYSFFDGSIYSVEKHENFRMYFILEIGSWLVDKHFWGMGLGTFGAVFSIDQFMPLYHSLGLTDNFENYVADVNWVSILGQIGVVGAIMFALFLLIFFLKVLRKGAKEKNGILLIAAALTLTWGISGIFGPNFEIKSNAMFFWLFLGLALRPDLKESIIEKD